MSQQQNRNMQAIKFTDEEIQILLECKSEGIYRRCIPLCVISHVLLGVAFKKNLISSSNKFLKYSIATIVPFGVGKFSYVKECNEKVKSRLSPESRLYKMMIERKYVEEEQSSATQKTVEPNIYDELRDRNRAKQPIDYSTLSTYDELRMRNRGIPEKQQIENPPPPPPQQQQQQQPVDIKSKNYKVNKYGDIIYED